MAAPPEPALLAPDPVPSLLYAAGCAPMRSNHSETWAMRADGRVLEAGMYFIHAIDAAGQVAEQPVLLVR